MQMVLEMRSLLRILRVLSAGLCCAGAFSVVATLTIIRADLVAVKAPRPWRSVLTVAGIQFAFALAGMIGWIITHHALRTIEPRGFNVGESKAQRVEKL